MIILTKLLYAFLAMGTFAVSYNYYQGFPFEVPVFFYWFLGAGIFGVSASVILGYLLGASAFSLTGSDFRDDIKMAFLLGSGKGVGRLWPYMAAWTVGSFFGESPIWHTLVSLLITGCMYAIHVMVNFIWSKVKA